MTMNIRERTQGEIFCRIAFISFLLLLTGGAWTQGPTEPWKEYSKQVSNLVGHLSMNKKKYVVSAARYNPDARIIHDFIDQNLLPVRFTDARWRSMLSDAQYRILRKNGTERAFSGELNNNTRRGVYYSAATGQPLFHSEDRFDSRTGWPSFTKPITPDAVAYAWDTGFFSRRIEVVESLSGSHLGHVFNDGPDPTGQRYCINSAALIFVETGGQPPPLRLP